MPDAPPLDGAVLPDEAGTFAAWLGAGFATGAGELECWVAGDWAGGEPPDPARHWEYPGGEEISDENMRQWALLI